MGVRILTGPVRSGKTSALLRYTRARKDCGGVLSPDGPDGRVLRNARTGETIPWQKKTADGPDDLVVGRFVLDAGAFRTALKWLEEAVQDPGVREIVLDEAGPLELAGRGWDDWIRGFAALAPEHKDLLLVARESVVDALITRYGLVDAIRIRPEDLA